MEHPNATRMRRTVGALVSSDIPRLLEGFAEDVVWWMGRAGGIGAGSCPTSSPNGTASSRA